MSHSIRASVQQHGPALTDGMAPLYRMLHLARRTAAEHATRSRLFRAIMSHCERTTGIAPGALLLTTFADGLYDVLAADSHVSLRAVPLLRRAITHVLSSPDVKALIFTPARADLLMEGMYRYLRLYMAVRHAADEAAPALETQLYMAPSAVHAAVRGAAPIAPLCFAQGALISHTLPFMRETSHVWPCQRHIDRHHPLAYPLACLRLRRPIFCRNRPAPRSEPCKRERSPRGGAGSSGATSASTRRGGAVRAL